MLDELQAETAETVAISALNDLEMQFLWVSRGRQAISLHIEEGQVMPVRATSVGQALMSRWSTAEVKAFVKRFKRWRPGETPLDETEAMTTAAAVRARDYAAVYDQTIVGVGSIAVAIPLAYNRNLVISVGGPSQRIRDKEAEIVDTLRRVTSKHNHELPVDNA